MCAAWHRQIILSRPSVPFPPSLRANRHLLPPLKEIEVRVQMDDHTEIMYANFKRDCIAVLNDDEVIATLLEPDDVRHV